MQRMQAQDAFIYGLLFMCVVYTTTAASSLWQERTSIVCEDEEFTAQCPRDSTIVIKEANYGHIGMSKCVEVDTGHFGCQTSIVDLLRQRCSGKESCSIKALDPAIKSLNPCRRGLHVFLDMSYLCITAAPIQPCSQTLATAKPSYIFNQHTTEQGCSSQSHMGGTQYFISAKTGQKIKISYLILTSSKARNDTRQVGYIVDEGEDQVHPIQVNVRRRSLVPLMVTKSNEITISLHRAVDVQLILFLEAIGCQDLRQPEGMTVQREGDLTTVSCPNSYKSWNLRCIGVHWAGVIGNCSEGDSPRVEAVLYQPEYALALPKDIIFMTIVGITAVLALIIVTMGYVCYKRTAESLEPTVENAIAYNDLKGPNGPPLPQKRGSTLLRNIPSQGTIQTGQQSYLADDPNLWEQPAPLPPPPRRENTRNMEAVPLRSEDLLLDNGNSGTILIRGDVPHQ